MGTHDATAPDFAAMYCELGLDASCSIEAWASSPASGLASVRTDELSRRITAHV